MHACMYVCMYVYVCIYHKQTNIHTYIHTYIHAYMNAYIHTCMYVRTHTHTRLLGCIYKNAYMQTLTTVRLRSLTYTNLCPCILQAYLFTWLAIVHPASCGDACACPSVVCTIPTIPCIKSIRIRKCKHETLALLRSAAMFAVALPTCAGYQTLVGTCSASKSTFRL